jgi:hypothetical protein
MTRGGVAESVSERVAGTRRESTNVPRRGRKEGRQQLECASVKEGQQQLECVWRRARCLRLLFGAEELALESWKVVVAFGSSC